MSKEANTPRYKRGDLNTGKTASERNPRKSSKKGYGVYRLAAVCFGLLSVLQATLNVSLRVFFHRCVGTNISWNEDSEQLKVMYSSLTKERDQLQASHIYLTTERDQLKTSFKNLTTERDQLKTSFKNLSTERDNLQRKLSKLENASAHGWKYFSSSFYFISSEQRAWRESKHNCKERGADLVVINSREEQKFVVDFGKEMEKIAWVGATDHDKEGVWMWVDGTPVITGYWMNDQPDNGFMGEDCIALLPDRYDPFKTWDDASCDLKLHWICEKVARL